ncbi:MAG: N-6 DNA methylase [Thermoguttaceae bacterium]|nr:N-6 DNA methylase [Thermoguttaceae bacterium]
MTRSNGAPASDRQYKAAWQKRFGVKSPRAAQAAAMLAAAFASRAEGAEAGFRQVQAALRSTALFSSPVPASAAWRALIPGAFSAANPLRVPQEDAFDAFVFILQSYVAQIIFAALQAYCGLTPEETRLLFGTTPFDWAAFVQERLDVRQDDLDALQFDRRARTGGPFDETYAKFFPSQIRRQLGEYYTPAPLADSLCERAAQAAGTDAPDFLDPACGAGVFLAAAFRFLTRRGIPPGEALERIAGFDLNPLAVVAARANLYAAAAADAPQERRADLLRTAPRAKVCVRDALAPPEEDARYRVVLGNPPWLAWDKLAPDYRARTDALWRAYGLFNLSARDARYGGSKKELASLVLYAAVDRYLAPNGVLAFVLPKALFIKGKSGEGFRQFGEQLGKPFQVLAIDDFSALDLFSGVQSKASAILLRNGARTVYPIPVRIWTPRAGARTNGPASGSDSVREFAERVGADCAVGRAWPAAPTPGASLRFDPPAESRPQTDRTSELAERIMTDAAARKLPRGYKAQLGANAAGGSGVFWLERADLTRALAAAVNLNASGKRPVARVEAALETALLFPLLRWRDVAEYRCNSPETVLLCPQDPEARRGFSEEIMQTRYPNALRYLAQFEEELKARAAYRRYQNDAPYWSLYNVDARTFAPYKVVWRRMDKTVRAALVGPDPASGKPILPQETLAMTPVESPEEGDYLTALLNSSYARRLFESSGAPGAKSFGSPGAFNALPIPKYDPASPVCRALAEIGADARKKNAASEFERRA